jgi:hypothetical protein
MKLTGLDVLNLFIMTVIIVFVFAALSAMTGCATEDRGPYYGKTIPVRYILKHNSHGDEITEVY